MQGSAKYGGLAKRPRNTIIFIGTCTGTSEHGNVRLLLIVRLIVRLSVRLRLCVRLRRAHKAFNHYTNAPENCSAKRYRQFAKNMYEEFHVEMSLNITFKGQRDRSKE